ncbi:hypothetical protein ACPXCE_21830 [Streptomyces sp. DT24]|uniref:hypothetical protein n=1 Tax=Streptomyces sp. DT24 TaxID=3416520 RepID=UPI003CFAC6FA
MTTRDTGSVREAAADAAGCLVALAGAVAGLLLWAPYGGHGLLGGFEGATAWRVLWLGLPVMTVGGAVAALTVRALARRRWRRTLGLGLLLVALAAIGTGYEVLAGPPSGCGTPGPC